MISLCESVKISIYTDGSLLIWFSKSIEVLPDFGNPCSKRDDVKFDKWEPRHLKLEGIAGLTKCIFEGSFSFLTHQSTKQMNFVKKKIKETKMTRKDWIKLVDVKVWNLDRDPWNIDHFTLFYDQGFWLGYQNSYKG